MSLLFETILIQDGEIKNLPYHQQRLNRSLATLFSPIPNLDLASIIHIPDYFSTGRVKCRVSYDECIQSVSFSFYEPRKIQSILTVLDDDISYTHKYEDHLALKKLFDSKGSHSEILIIKNGYVTDSFYYNVAFYKNRWFTPEQPLLPGTMRAYLLDENQIIPRKITLEEIPTYSKICLFNALNPFGEIVLPIDKIM